MSIATRSRKAGPACQDGERARARSLAAPDATCALASRLFAARLANRLLSIA